MAGLCLLVVASLLPMQNDAPVRKIVLLAADKDGHPPGAHEYLADMQALAKLLKRTGAGDRLAVEVHDHGWPDDPGTLDDADCIVLYGRGSSGRETDHAFLVGDRMKTVEKQAARGCGLVLLHWSTFFPDRLEKTAFDLFGGHFDHQGGAADNGYESEIGFFDTQLTPAGEHPILRGVPPFTMHDELYYKLKFASGAQAPTPVLTFVAPDHKKKVIQPQTVAWAVERADRHRAFCFTGAHFSKNLAKPEFRTLLLNAVLWCAKVEIPADGIEVGPDDATARADPIDPAWTPKPGGTGNPAWMNEKDADWEDDRFGKMDTGAFLGATFAVPVPGRDKPEIVPKGLAVKLDGGGMIFDRNLLRWVCAWTTPEGEPYLEHKTRRFGLMNTAKPNGTVGWTTPRRAGVAIGDASADWTDPRPSPYVPLPESVGRFLGLQTVAGRVRLLYEVGGRVVWDEPLVTGQDNGPVLRRGLRVMPGEDDVSLFVGDAACEGVGTFAEIERQRLRDGWLHVPAGSRQWAYVVTHATDSSWAGDVDRTAVGRHPDIPPETHSLPVSRGSAAGAYAVDTFALPFDNDADALLFCSGLDFLPGGTLALSTAHGDVWLVEGVHDADATEVRWTRFATGLYQPLGLKVVDGVVHVLERGQLTRLHDTKSDGAADLYENVNNQWATVGDEHGFDTSLETDSEGNFCFCKGAGTETAWGGSLIQVSADGSKAEVVANGFRHPNGMGIGPGDFITVADQQGNWVPASPIHHVTPGGFYGFMPAARNGQTARDRISPMVNMPHDIDNSGGGQVWTPDERFGLPPGTMLHLSWGQCTLNLVLPDTVDGVIQAAVTPFDLPKFLSGPGRARFSPIEGHLYVCGMDGWQTAAVQDGCLQRVRWTGRTPNLPASLRAHENGIRLTFMKPLDLDRCRSEGSIDITQWNSRYGAKYGSDDWSVRRLGKKGRDPVAVAELRPTDEGVFIATEPLVPVDQMRIVYRLYAADGTELTGRIVNTIRKLRPPLR